jgi:D-apionolactonase
MAGIEEKVGPKTVVLRSAHGSVNLDPPTLRSLSWGGVELIQSLPASVRDRNWGTVPGLVTDLESSASGSWQRVTFVCTHDNGDVGFVWEGEVSATSSNPRSCVIAYSMVGRATREFSANRIGLCVLHPLSVAGRSVSLRSLQGKSAGVFPQAVSPHQTFLELTGMSYTVGDAGVDICFDGGLFETEDQRNWTDASFKTYSPPLSVPFPRAYKEGEELRQRVVVELTGPPARGYRSYEGERAIGVHLGRILPVKLPAIGIGIDGPEPPGGQADIEDAIRRLRPSYLHTVVDPHRQGWQARLRAAVATTSDVGASVQCEVVVAEPGELRPVAEALAENGGPLSRVMLFDQKSSVTTPEVLSMWLRLAPEFALEPLVFAGSRANFAELNRNQPSHELISGLTFPINPQVHAFGDDEVVETLPVQEVVARQAADVAQGLALHVGPVTLKPRFNAVATDELAAEPAADPRQSSWWAAGWTLGSIAALARGGAEFVTYFNALGPDGLLGYSASGSPGSFSPYPVFEVLCRVVAIGPAYLVAAHVTDEKAVAVLALSKHGQLFLFAANLSGAARAIRLEGQAFDLAAVRLTAGNEPPTDGHVTVLGGNEFHLEPYELVFLTGPTLAD